MTKTPTRLPIPEPGSRTELNKVRLIAAAKQRFAERGTGASLEQIARDAEVGIGTLYRHFPTRDHLIEAVYRNETDRLVDAATELSLKQDPLEALHDWLMLFMKFLATKQDMRDVLDSLIGGSEVLYSGTASKLAPPIEMLVNHANQSGVVKIEIPPLDLLRAIAGIASIRPGANWRKPAINLVNLILLGAKHVVDKT